MWKMIPRTSEIREVLREQIADVLLAGIRFTMLC
jgi:hypothetical protein